MVKVAFDLEIPQTWHIYAAGKKPLFGTPTGFAFQGAEISGQIPEPPLKLKKEEGIGDIDYHEGRSRSRSPSAQGGRQTGPARSKGRIDYQICDPNLCVDNSTPFSFTLKVAPGATPRGRGAPNRGLPAAARRARPRRNSSRKGWAGSWGFP